MTPEQYYAQAESLVALAMTADRELHQIDKTRDHRQTVIHAFSRYTHLAELNRTMAETGLAFVPGKVAEFVHPPEILAVAGENARVYSARVMSTIRQYHEDYLSVTVIDFDPSRVHEPFRLKQDPGPCKAVPFVQGVRQGFELRDVDDTVLAERMWPA